MARQPEVLLVEQASCVERMQKALVQMNLQFTEVLTDVNRVRQALKMADMSLSRSDSALGAFCCWLCARMAKPQVNTATAHSSQGWCTSCCLGARTSSTRANSARMNSSANARRRPQTPRRRARLPDQSHRRCNVNSDGVSSVS